MGKARPLPLPDLEGLRAKGQVSLFTVNPGRGGLKEGRLPEEAGRLPPAPARPELWEAQALRSQPATSPWPRK